MASPQNFDGDPSVPGQAELSSGPGPFNLSALPDVGPGKSLRADPVDFHSRQPCDKVALDLSPDIRWLRWRRLNWSAMGAIDFSMS